MIIALNGYAGSGKDEIGKIIQYLKTPTYVDYDKYRYIHNFYKTDWEIKKWAGKLKQIASLLTYIEITKFEDQEFKKSTLGSEWDDMTIREFLQKLGTDGLRNGLHPNVWVNALMSEYNKKSKWIITDTRFPNEAQAVKDKGGIMIRVNRNGVKPANSHPSEVGLDNWDFDHIIENNGSIEDLIESVKKILILTKF